MGKFILISKKTAVLPVAFCLILFQTETTLAANTKSSSESNDNLNQHTINLRTAITKTIEYNPSLRVFDLHLKSQQGQVQQAGLAPSPEINLQLEDVIGTGASTGISKAQATLSISWVLERGVRQHYVSVAQAGASLIEVEADIKQLDAAAETARRYLVSLAYQARGKIADKTVQLAKETITSVKKRVEAGKTPKAELSRALAELARRNLQHEDIKHQLLSANRRLAAQWGQSSPMFTHVAGDIIQLPEVTSFDRLKSSLPQNPELLRLLSKQQLKKAELTLAFARNKPNLRLNAGVRHLNSNNNQAFIAGFSIPFGARTRNPGRIATAQANLDKTHLEEREIRIRIETSIYVIYNELQHNLHVINALHNDIIPPLERALTETRRAYNIGRYSYLELRSVQEELLNAHNELLEASINIHGYIIEIERLTGVRVTQSTSILK